MISTIWRVKTDHFDSKEFIAKHKLEPSSVFKSGFNLCLFDESSKDYFIKNLTEALEKHQDSFNELMEHGIASQIDIGVSVGTEDQYTCSIVLPTEIVKQLSKYNIEISFSAYPACG